MLLELVSLFADSLILFAIRCRRSLILQAGRYMCFASHVLPNILWLQGVNQGLTLFRVSASFRDLLSHAWDYPKLNTPSQWHWIVIWYFCFVLHFDFRYFASWSITFLCTLEDSSPYSLASLGSFKGLFLRIVSRTNTFSPSAYLVQGPRCLMFVDAYYSISFGFTLSHSRYLCLLGHPRRWVILLCGINLHPRRICSLRLFDHAQSCFSFLLLLLLLNLLGLIWPSWRLDIAWFLVCWSFWTSRDWFWPSWRLDFAGW